MGFIYYPKKADGLDQEEVEAISQQVSVNEITKKLSEPYFASEEILADTVVCLDDDGNVFVMSADNEQHKGRVCGVAIAPASIGDEVNVFMTGEVQLGRSITTNRKVYVGKDGELSTDLNSLKNDIDVKFLQIVGRSIKGNKLVIDIKPAVWK